MSTSSQPDANLDDQNPALSRLPLARKNQTLSFERRIYVWLAAAAFPILLPIAILLHQHNDTLIRTLSLTAAASFCYLVLASLFIDQLIRPLQTLTNVVSALRENDYSFRARGARRGDSVGDLALEINALAGMLQRQRSAAQDALTLLERVVTAMHSPVLAFDAEGKLHLFNPAARNTFSLGPADPIGRTAADLHLDQLLALPDLGLYPPETAASPAFTSQPVRWSVRRTTFRIHGKPHTLLVLSDVAAVLREEERLAWQRLIRVLSHEINNSLTPIKSIAGSLRTRLAVLNEDDATDFSRGLSVIEERAASLNRFLQAYQRLTHLPPPTPRPTDVLDLVSRTTALETRLPIAVIPGPPTAILCDSDQLQQGLINLIQNATDAALSTEAATPDRTPAVTLRWRVVDNTLTFLIEDNGLGIDNPSNLFVPFYTTKPLGSGIGLVLVQQIATAHGGSVRLLPREGQRGCIAELSLPLS